MRKRGLITRFFLFFVINTPVLICIFLTSFLLVLGYWHDVDPQHYEGYIKDLLGVQDSVLVSDPVLVDGVATSIEPFEITYWNGSSVRFYAQPEVWDAVVEAYTHFEWCDPRLNIAVAFSESPSYTNHRRENSATALGTWQFISSTWQRLWEQQIPNLYPELIDMFPYPDRTDIRAAAYAACVYYRLIGLDDAYSKGEEHFVKAFMGWNRHRGQALFVYRLYHELQLRTGGKPTVVSVSRLVLSKPSPLKVVLLVVFLKSGLLPEVAYAFDNPGGDAAEDWFYSVPTDDCVPILSRYALGPRGYHTGCEGTNLACGLIKGYDYIAPEGELILAPMNGRISGKYYDSLGNSVLTINLENGLEMGIMHLHFPPLAVGASVERGEQIGTVGNIGNSSQPHVHIWLRSKSENISNQAFLFCK